MVTGHGLYVMAAYGISAVCMAALIAWIVLDRQARRRELTELEANGIRRRSDKTGDAHGG